MAGQDSELIREAVWAEVKNHFRPEFLNRIDEIIIFSPLTLEQVELIVDLQMKEVRERLSEHNLQVDLTDDARKWLAKEGYDPAFGARPLRRAIQKYVESPLSVKILEGEYHDGETVVVDVNTEEGGLLFRRPPSKKPARTPQPVVTG
jgi:ATP-dependent Clp protease ATP-binding subunit ClpA